MRTFFFICLIAFLGACTRIDKGPLFAIEHFRDGKVSKIKCFTNDSILDGPVIVFYQSGRLKTVYQLDRGKLEGSTFHFFENGSLHQAIGYHAGLLDSTTRVYYRNGQVRLVYNFYEGLKRGDQYQFDSLGRDLRYQYYSSDGTLLFEKDFETGHEYSNLHGGYFDVISVEIVPGEAGYIMERILCVHPPHWDVQMYAYRAQGNQILKPILVIPITSGVFNFCIPNRETNENWKIVYQFHDSLDGKRDSTSVDLLYK